MGHGLDEIIAIIHEHSAMPYFSVVGMSSLIGQLTNYSSLVFFFCHRGWYGWIQVGVLTAQELPGQLFFLNYFFLKKNICLFSFFVIRFGVNGCVFLVTMVGVDDVELVCWLHRSCGQLTSSFFRPGATSVLLKCSPFSFSTKIIDRSTQFGSV